jgi:hypothetical protein
MPMFEPRDVAPPKSYSPMPVEKYLRGREYMDLAKGGVANMFRERPRYAEGGTGFKNVSTTPIYSTSDYADPLGYTGKNYGYLTLEELQNLYKGNPDKINIFGKDIAPGDLIRALDIFQANSSGSDPRFYIRNLPEGTSTSTPTTTEFQPYQAQSTPYDFISNRLENVFNNPSIKGYSNFITGSESPFQNIDQFTSSQQSVINQAIQNATNQGRTNITYADYPQTGIAQLMDDGFTPMEYLKTLGSSIFGNPVDQIKTTLGQFSYNPETNKIFDRYDFQRQSGNNLGTPYDVNINLRNNPVQRTVNVGSSDIGTQALGASVGNLDFATMNALRNNADLLNTITGQKVNMAYGGRVSMSNGGLTNTIPPDRGPSSQGVESLFTRRYN